MDVGIAHGEGVLYEIRAGQYTAWAGTASTDQVISISKPSLFGGSEDPGEGGMSGSFRFIPGDLTGTIVDSAGDWTGRTLQPGLPGMARGILYGSSKGFYFGNSESYPALSFVYAMYPDTQDIGYGIINGDQGNPAYFLIELNKNVLWGLGMTSGVDTASLTAMALQLHTEGLGMSRVWYEGDAPGIEREVLDYIDGVRYRNPTTGDITYRLIRDDYDVDTIPTFGDDEIMKLKFGSDGISGTATRVSVEYIDIDGNFETKKMSTPNIAVRQALQTTKNLSIEYWGAGHSTVARKLTDREARKRTRPRRSGEVVLTRQGWDLAVGDTIKINYGPIGLLSMVVRVVEHSKGSIKDGKVTVKFIE
jgi:hypothetical protein